jgi:hypothetical protein
MRTGRIDHGVTMTIPNTLLYMLDHDHNVIRATSVEEWSEWIQNHANKRVESTDIYDGRWVSTVFLGVNHECMAYLPPILFETMVFPSRTDMNEEHCDRYATWGEAYIGHWRIVREYTISLCKEVS